MSASTSSSPPAAIAGVAARLAAAVLIVRELGAGPPSPASPRGSLPRSWSCDERSLMFRCSSRRRAQPTRAAYVPAAPLGVRCATYPPRGPVTALRVLGHGFEIPVEAKRADVMMVGERLTYKGQAVLAIDEPTRQLIEPLTAFGGLGAHADVDEVLMAVLWLPRRPILLHGARVEDVLELARTIHEHTIRKGFPFTPVTAVPTSTAEIEELCTRGGCGTLVFDFTAPVELPQTLVGYLFPERDREHYHLATIAASTVEDARRCFGAGLGFSPRCALGFRKVPWHSAMKDVTFTQD